MFYTDVSKTLLNGGLDSNWVATNNSSCARSYMEREVVLMQAKTVVKSSSFSVVFFVRGEKILG